MDVTISENQLRIVLDKLGMVRLRAMLLPEEELAKKRGRSWKRPAGR